MSIGKFARELILASPELKNEEVLTKIKKQFPEAKTTYACVAWYKSDLRKRGLISKRAARSKDVVEAEILVTKNRLAGLEAELEGFEEKLEEAVEAEPAEAGADAEAEEILAEGDEEAIPEKKATKKKEVAEH